MTTTVEVDEAFLATDGSWYFTDDGKGPRRLTRFVRERPAEKIRLAPISNELHVALDRFRSESYAEGADAVWRSLGVGPLLPNEAVWDDAKGIYVIRSKQPDA